MNVVVEEKEDYSVLRLKGRMDATSMPLLESKIDHLIQKKVLRVLLDFSHVDYLSSAGLRFLLAATKKVKSSGGLLVISSVAEEVMEIIKMAGFERILHIFPNEKKALEALLS
jgi:anti-anti-sigma factor